MRYADNDVSTDKCLAAHYSKLPADQGQVDVQYNYGVLLSCCDGMAMNKSRAAHSFKLSADQGWDLAQVEDAMFPLDCNRGSLQFEECEKYLRLGLWVLLAVIDRFNLTEARYWFSQLSNFNRFAAFLHDSLLTPECEFVTASDFSRRGSPFSLLCTSFDASILLIQCLNRCVSCITLKSRIYFPAWHEIAAHSLGYLVELSHAQLDLLRSSPSD